MKLYLAGPMRGIPGFNIPAFEAAAAKLRAQGHEVFVPPEETEKLWGPEIYALRTATGDEAVLAKKLGMTELEFGRRTFGHDLTYICNEAEGVALLPGWRNSKGARAEYATAVALGLWVVEL